MLVLTTVVVLFTVVRSFVKLERTNDARVHAETTLALAGRTQAAVVDMENGLQTYLLTGRRDLLGTWFSGRADFWRSYASLAALERNHHSGDEALIATIGTLGKAYIRGYGDPIVLAGPKGVRGRKLAISGEGERRLNQLRAVFASVSALDTRQNDDRTASSRRAYARARVTAEGGLALIVLLVGVNAVYLLRRVVTPVRRIAAAAQTLTRGNMSARAPVKGPGEVAGLGATFNEMAASLETALSAATAQNARLQAAYTAAQTSADELIAQQDMTVDLVATIGFDGYFKRVNLAWERTLGYTHDELRSRPFIEYVHPDDVERTKAEEAKLEAVGGRDTINFENRYRTKSGDYRWLEWNVRPNLEQQLLQAVARDVTDRKQADLQVRAAQATAERANQAKSEFLSRMSHELRTPLNAILGFGQLLEMDELRSDQRQSVDQILHGGRHLLGLIDEVLDISRIESGTMRTSVEPVDLHSALGEVTSLIAPVAEAAGITLSLDRGDVGHCYVLADRLRLRQVVLNLLSNAVKYNRPGGSVTVTIVPSDERVRIEVSDSGWGIPAEQLDRLFVAFDRLGADEGTVEGTGLGLALSKSLAEQMGGELSARSTHGEGSVFTLDLERAANPIDADALAGARRAGRADRAGRAGREASTLGAHTILHIEDNPADVTLVAQAFSSQPALRLLAAMQGSTGVELARAHRPDLILLDLDLPDADGATVLKRLKADPVTTSIPVIVISADAAHREIRALLGSGAAAYLTKPLDVPGFLRVAEQHLPHGVA